MRSVINNIRIPATFKTYAELPRRTLVMSLCFGLGLANAVISVTVSALVGDELAPNSALSTIPYGLQFLALIVTSLPSSLLMRKFGRKPVLLAGCVCGMAASALGVLAISVGNFYILCFAHFLLGVMLANINLLRFAAVDISPPRLQSTALGLLLFGGVFAAIVGPFFARSADLVIPLEAFPASYAAIGVLALIVFLILMWVKMEPVATVEASQRVPIMNFIRNRVFIFAVYCGSIGYLVMNLLMISSSLEMRSLGISFSTVSYIIQIHVLAMFAPSLFSGRILAKFGIRKTVAAGVVLQLATGTVAILFNSTVGFLIALLLLGLAWNLLYTSGSYLAARAAPPHLKFQAQGVNDTFVGVASTVGALGAGGLLSTLNWDNLNYLAIAISATIVLLALSIVFFNGRRPLKA